MTDQERTGHPDTTHPVDLGRHLRWDHGLGANVMGQPRDVLELAHAQRHAGFGVGADHGPRDHRGAGMPEAFVPAPAAHAALCRALAGGDGKDGNPADWHDVAHELLDVLRDLPLEQRMESMGMTSSGWSGHWRAVGESGKVLVFGRVHDKNSVHMDGCVPLYVEVPT